MSVELKCKCGSFRGEIQNFVDSGNRMICMCDDCQAKACFAGCCNTPIANSPASAFLPFLGVVCHIINFNQFLDSPEKNIAAVSERLNGKFGNGALPTATNKIASLSAIGKVQGLRKFCGPNPLIKN